MNNVIFGKTMANLRKPRGIKLATTERRKNYLVLEPNYEAKKLDRISISNRNEKNSDTFE